MKIGNWIMPDRLDTERDFKVTLDMNAIHQQMAKLEEDATRHAIITWLRTRGYTVTRPPSGTSNVSPTVAAIARHSGLPEEVCEQLMHSGWTFTDEIGRPPRWESPLASLTNPQEETRA